ncbi:MAG: 1,4-alpha-glucan-branching enzyme [Chlorobi bacterium]|nr:1,4-alpha-glucan-branching enzyme [Chlorobiota bacterium]
MEIPFIKNDPFLKPFEQVIKNRLHYIKTKEKELTGGKKLSDFALARNYFGLHKIPGGRIYRDKLPGASEVYLTGDFSGWKPLKKYRLKKDDEGNLFLKIPLSLLKHKDLYRLYVRWEGGEGDRIPAYAERVVQDADTGIFNAQVWDPPEPYKFKHKSPPKKDDIFIYEAHPGMASEEEKISSFKEFTENVLPEIRSLGYDTLQLMAVQEHPWYASFGYHVSNFFAVSSRFGTPDDLKELIDTAHSFGIRVIMDLVHSHAVKNEVEGLSKYDGTEYLFFHAGSRGYHPAWDSRCFDYGKDYVMHFLLSNCKFWLEEYKFDGFRFDGVTSMIYLNHGLNTDFNSYEDYFNDNIDLDALTYLYAANKLIHEINPDAVTIAEEVSGMPGTASPVTDGGLGFDFRLAMGIPDFWIRTIKEQKDENWHVGNIFYRLTDKRKDEKNINYSESHDQAIVGDKTLIFRLADADMYYFMSIANMNIITERAVALHKIILMLTAATAQTGYLNFMGNEFGHPEWIDFPREGNNYSYRYARRQWSLARNKNLAYYYLKAFNSEVIHLLKCKRVLISDINLISEKPYDQVLIFGRDKFIFVFNLNPFTSFTDYGFETEKGEYKIILNSDDETFLGKGRVDTEMIYKTTDAKGKSFLKLYIPSRTCFVLRKQ